MTTQTPTRAVLLGRLSPQLTDWREEFVTPLMQEAIVRTVRDAVRAQGAELEGDEPSARWRKNGVLVNDTTIGATPCWVWWVK